MTLLAALIVVGAITAMASGRVPAALVLALALAVAGLTGLAPTTELVSGLGNSSVITVAGMLVIAKGVVQTGAVTRLTWWLLSGATGARQAFLRLLAPLGVLSSMIVTTPIVAMLVPAARQLQDARGVSARELLLPMTHTLRLAGSVTLIGASSNLLIAGLVEPYGISLDMFAFAPIALPTALAGCTVLALVGPRLLRGKGLATGDEMVWRVEIPVGSGASVLGRVPADLGVGSTRVHRLLGIERWGRMLEPTRVVEAGDVLVYAATEDGIRALWGSPRFGLTARGLYAASVAPGEHGTLDDLEHHGDLKVIAAHTDGALRDTAATPGRTCYVTCSHPDVLSGHRALNLWQRVAGPSPQPGKTWIAVAILGGVVVASSLELLPVAMAAFCGGLLMVLTGVLSPRSAARALDWNLLFILAGSVGLGAIVLHSGLADRLGHLLTIVSSGSDPLAIVVLAVAAAALGNLVTSAAAAAILTPVALAVAGQLGLDPIVPLALVGTCISLTFVNPFGHQSNLMVMGPGGYSIGEFIRLGAPVLAVCLLVSSIMGQLLVG